MWRCRRTDGRTPCVKIMTTYAAVGARWVNTRHKIQEKKDNLYLRYVSQILVSQILPKSAELQDCEKEGEGNERKAKGDRSSTERILAYFSYKNMILLISTCNFCFIESYVTINPPGRWSLFHVWCTFVRRQKQTTLHVMKCAKFVFLLLSCHQWSPRPGLTVPPVAIAIFSWKLFCLASFWKVNTDDYFRKYWSQLAVTGGRPGGLNTIAIIFAMTRNITWFRRNRRLGSDSPPILLYCSFFLSFFLEGCISC